MLLETGFECHAANINIVQVIFAFGIKRSAKTVNQTRHTNLFACLDSEILTSAKPIPVRVREFPTLPIFQSFAIRFEILCRLWCFAFYLCERNQRCLPICY